MVKRSAAVVVAAVWVLTGSMAVAAHTETDLVALPAGEAGTIVFRPTHGCGESGTVEVAVRAPVEGAAAGAVDGWESSAEPDGQGNTVLTWTGGMLATDAIGAFPVEFDVPDRVGELLIFPAVQVCENGEELAWIDGDPESSLPAPRILVLAAGSAPAASIDEVPPDAPGRDLLVEVVDVDNPSGTTTTTATTSPTTTVAETTTTTAETTTTTVAASDATDLQDEDSGGGWVIPAAFVLGGLIGVGLAFARRRR